jgi:hypothetical protein
VSKGASARALGLFAAIAVCLAALLPTAAPARHQAAAQSLGEGLTVTGDFKGAGRAQIASLYDLDEDLGLRIVVLDRTGTTDTFTSEQWTVWGPGSFDTSRAKIAATDVDGDGKTDIVVLYDDAAGRKDGAAVRLLVFRSTGTSFQYLGAWWQSSAYAFSRVATMLAGTFSASGRAGLLLVYQYDGFQMRIHYLESDGTKFVYNGDAGVYDSGRGQYDTTRARFAIGRFTRASGFDQIASIYQYPNDRIRIHVFDPSPAGLVPLNGWAGVYDSGEGQYELGRMKIAAGDVDGDGKSDIASLYSYPDGSTRVQMFSGALGLGPVGGAAGIGYTAPGVLGWAGSRVLAGDWNADKRADLVALEGRSDGKTYASMLVSSGAAVALKANAWVSPPNEVSRMTCAAECWPLTGLPHNGGAVARRGLNVRIDNVVAARPHYGISEADMVFEMLVEGYLTRLSAIFHMGNPGTMGSIRSARLSDRYITPMIRGALVYSGATIEETDAFRRDAATGAYYDMNATLGRGGYYRIPTRPVPYNMFTSSDSVRDALNGLPGGGDPVSIPRWDFLRRVDHATTAGGLGASVPATEIAIPYRSAFTVRYQYDPATRSYARWQHNGGAFVREVDAANGVAVAARNIVIVHTEIWETSIIQDIFNSRGLDMNLIGGGPATIFRDGRRLDGLWARPTINDAFAFWTRNGERVYLSPGQTWVHPIPHSWTVTSN